ncbi:MAG: DUF1211 domain-containing protein [Alphaproteobacteria bacterium]|nr:DUF1211 domain-containing protein [Alphaproteobacteria bacterium]
MGKGRLEAFSDGVIAVIITIMVLELKAPHGPELSELLPQVPVLLVYVLSFVNVGIYWVNHHHFYHAVHKVSGGLLWANLHLLFWLSLMPFTTAWMGENHFATWPIVVYGVDLLACAAAWSIMQVKAVRANGPESELARAVGASRKEKISLALYLAGIILAFFITPLALACYVAVAVMWFVPDKRVERVLR